MDPTRARLLEAAGEEFAEHGFAGATVRSICKRAGANIAAVNYHFGDKEQLYHQAVLEAHRCGLGEPVAETEDGPPQQRLRWFVRAFLDHVLATDGPRSWQRALMLQEMIRPTDASETLVRESIAPRFAVLRQILAELDPAADERRLDALSFSVVGQCLHYKVGRPIAERLIGVEALERLDLAYLTEHISGLVLAALGHGDALARGGVSHDGACQPREGRDPCTGSR